MPELERPLDWFLLSAVRRALRMRRARRGYTYLEHNGRLERRWPDEVEHVIRHHGTHRGKR